jgi:hypothetical protein
LHISKHSGLDEVATVSSGLSTTQQLCPLLLPGFNITKNLLKLSFIHLWERKPRVEIQASSRCSAENHTGNEGAGKWAKVLNKQGLNRKYARSRNIIHERINLKSHQKNAYRVHCFARVWWHMPELRF